MMYKVHKWIAVTVGMFILVWLISGIVMILPRTSTSPGIKQKPEPVNFREITVSPAKAVERLDKVLGTSPQVKRVNLRQIQDTLVYEVTVNNGSLYLIDAVSAEVFAITPEIAEQIVREAFPTQGHILQIERVDRHDLSYRWGSLPAYRIVFDDDRGTFYTVSMKNGTVRRSDFWNRIRVAIESFHTFEPVKVITKRSSVRKGLLILFSILGIGAAGTGYFLSLPRRHRQP